MINGLTLANTTDLNTSATVLITRGGQDVFIVKDATVPAGGSMIVAGRDQKIALIAGDQLKARSAQAASIDVWASALLTGAAAAGGQAVVLAPQVIPSILAGVNPNSAVTFTISNLVPTSGTLYWTLEGDNLTTADFSGGSLSGTVVITGGAGSVTATPTFYAWDKTWRLQIRTVSISGTIVATSPYVSMTELGIFSNGLVLNLDASVALSYPGSGTAWNDISGAAANGTLITGAAYTTDAGGAIVFDGVNDRVDISPGSFNLSALTVNMWFKTADITTDYLRLIHKADTTGATRGFFIANSNIDGKLVFGYQPNYTSGEILKRSSRTIATGVYHNVSMSYSAATGLKIYFNGYEEAGEISTAPDVGWTSNTGNLFSIGSRAGGTQNNPATIPVVSVYNRVLSQLEIINNFDAQRGRFGI